MRHDEADTSALDELLDLPAVPEEPTGQYEQIEFGTIREVVEKPNRHTVSEAAILSAEEVIYLVGGRASVTRRWLRQVRPLAHPSGRRVYLWGDVLAALKEVA